jgi:hypothetical protein
MSMHPCPYRFAASTSRSHKRHEEGVDILLIHLMLSVAAIIRKSCRRRHGGSAGKAENRNPGRLMAARAFDDDYFNCEGRRQRSGPSSCGRAAFEPDFGRRFRMPRTVYEQIRSCAMRRDSCFHDSKDAAGVPSASPDQKVTAALRMLCY